MINRVDTTYFIREEDTDGHHPMKFECNDGFIYYCKYRVSMKKEELDFLTYEVVAHYLLKSLGISTPEIALVTLTEDSFDKKDLIFNKKYSKSGTVCFGSRSIEGANLINGTQIFKQRKEVNKYENFTDLIKIAFFDLWLNNTDRGREDNLNILEAPVVGQKNKFKYYAIDNAFIFGGQHGLRFFNPSEQVNLSSKFIDNEYFKSILNFVSRKKRLESLDNFINLYAQNHNSALENAFLSLSDTWEVPDGLKTRIQNYISNNERMKIVSSIMAHKLGIK